VYSLTGFVGYQIDLTFEPGEAFVGLGAGDVEGLAFVAQDNHLFLKPRADSVSTNLTVLTTRRTYYFDYTAHALKPGVRRPPMLYSLRFTYPPTVAVRDAARIDKALGDADASRPPNLDYWYCGAPSLKPLAAQDDGVHTQLRFGARSELPAIFAQNEDGSESLVNYSIEGDVVLVHRVVRRLILRRGQLTGCVVNKSYSGGGERLESGTVTPGVDRATRDDLHE
jgi:type IV secretion system protein VirB9